MAIVNPTIVELSEKVDCRYTLVVEASKRARQLLSGAQPLIDPKEMKPLKIAVEEINRGLLTYTRNPDTEE
jgi:DNA-directed RNA polymerase subunit omega